MGLLGFIGVVGLFLVAGTVKAESTVAKRTTPVATAHLDFQVTIPRALTFPTAQACLAELEQEPTAPPAAASSHDRHPYRTARSPQPEREGSVRLCTAALP
ncbi:hypothetical protein [Lysobacter tyrosinilyticus]